MAKLTEAQMKERIDRRRALDSVRPKSRNEKFVDRKFDKGRQRLTHNERKTIISKQNRGQALSPFQSRVTTQGATTTPARRRGPQATQPIPDPTAQQDFSGHSVEELTKLRDSGQITAGHMDVIRRRQQREVQGMKREVAAGKKALMGGLKQGEHAAAVAAAGGRDIWGPDGSLIPVAAEAVQKEKLDAADRALGLAKQAEINRMRLAGNLKAKSNALAAFGDTPPDQGGPRTTVRRIEGRNKVSSTISGKTRFEVDAPDFRQELSDLETRSASLVEGQNARMHELAKQADDARLNRLRHITSEGGLTEHLQRTRPDLFHATPEGDLAPTQKSTVLENRIRSLGPLPDLPFRAPDDRGNLAFRTEVLSEYVKRGETADMATRKVVLADEAEKAAADQAARDPAREAIQAELAQLPIGERMQVERTMAQIDKYRADTKATLAKMQTGGEITEALQKEVHDLVDQKTELLEQLSAIAQSNRPTSATAKTATSELQAAIADIDKILKAKQSMLDDRFVRGRAIEAVTAHNRGDETLINQYLKDEFPETYRKAMEEGSQEARQELIKQREALIAKYANVQ